ncbi:PRC-barrel domain-containing protein [Pleomorphovibrio marinus]|uniref:PRC-barrel domain-containing protein n=1 Tax=Pleomorphovibrio marinus TaxID=2164132 RepID=UPI000E0AAEF8|nr:PRC-barrel domain-containing protein [Pleomorphovibrio marinus]
MKDELGNLILKASEITGTTVKNPGDETIGDIKEIMMDCATGESAYVLLSVDTGFLNMGSKYFAVPWEAFEFDTIQDDVFILDVDKEKLENSPGFDKDNWPTGPQADFIAKVRKYYGYEGRRDSSHIRSGVETNKTQRDNHQSRPSPDKKESEFLG